MRFVALVSGGKDSVFSLGKAMAHGHELICLANLYPPGTGPEELDSFMFQSAGATAIECLAECLGVPLLRAPLRGGSGHQGLHYAVTEGDEVEDLFDLLRHVKETYPEVEAVASGAVLSTYQRTRVESVCGRLGLQSLAFLWQYDQSALLEEMVASGLEAVLVKVASQGLLPYKHLGKSIAELTPVFQRLKAQYGFHVAGEGGEYETLALDAPFFKRRLVLDRTEVAIHSDDIYAPVGLLRILACHTEPKENEEGQDEGTTAAPPPLAALALPPAGARLLQEAAGAGPRSGGGEQPSPPPPPLPHLPSAILPRPRVWRQGRQLFVSGFSCPPSPSPNPPQPPPDPGAEAARQVTLCLEALQQALLAEGSSLTDVVFVHLYLTNLAECFGPANQAYCAAPFLGAHPPSRSCVEATPLPAAGAAAVMLDAWALQGSGAAMHAGGAFRDRQVLHVKSLSGWAPLCIGPYSQANLLAHGHLALLAGQIGLDPTTMALIQPQPPAAAAIADGATTNKNDQQQQQLELEAYQALHNCAAVLAALRSSLRAAVMVVAYINVGSNGGSEGSGDSIAAAAVDEWRRVCLRNAGYGRRLSSQQQQQQEEEEEGTASSAGSVDSGSGSGSEGEDEEDEDEDASTPALAADCPFLVVGVPDLPRGARVEFEVIALSRMLAGAVPPRTAAWAVEAAAGFGVVAEGADDDDDAVNPLPEPFQPSLPHLASPSSQGSPFAIAAQSLHLPSALLAVHCSAALPLPPSSNDNLLLLDYPALAAAVVAHVGRALAAAGLAWRQLSRLRCFYCPITTTTSLTAIALEEPLLREALAGALPPEAQGIARTFVPVSSLLQPAPVPESGGRVELMVLRVQALALDLERLRTEAWVHEVPDGGI